MLICHCNVVTEREIRDATRALLRDDPWELIVPAKLYRELGKRGRCCGCFPNVVETIIRVTEAFHARNGSGETEIVTYLDRVRGLRGQYGSRTNEGRTTGHRAA